VLAISDDDESARHVSVRIEAPAGLSDSNATEILLAVTEDDLTTKVGSGENAGRRLRHVAVVRTLAPVAEIAKGETPWKVATVVPLREGWRRAHVTLIAFAQERSTKAIVAAAAARLGPHR
jgi:hypothetical protein